MTENAAEKKGPISKFMESHYRHFNAAAMVDAAKGYEQHLLEGGKMLVTLAGAMSTAELGKSLAEMIRQDKVAMISCTGANLPRMHARPEHLCRWNADRACRAQDSRLEPMLRRIVWRSR